MKKIYAILAAAAALAAAVSCNKAETVEPEAEPGKVTVNITVASLTPETKAVKTGWTSGDIINVFVQTSDSYGSSTPDFTLTYDGSKWISSTISSEVESKLASGSKLMGYWEGSNGTASYSKESFYLSFPDGGKYNSTGIEDYVVTTFKEVAYTFSGGVLTASISGWEIPTSLQIVVSGITYEKGRYTLYSDELSNLSGIYTYGAYISVNFYGSGSEYGRIAGIANDDGVAFVGGSFTGTGSITLYLIDNEAGKTYSFKNPSATFNRILNAVKIPFSKFTEE